MKRKLICLTFALLPVVALAQGSDGKPLSLKECLDYSTQNNVTLQKDRLGIEEAMQSRREIVGSLLPQLNASAGYTYNIQKTTIAMPNFVNSMMPEPMRDPNAAKYMTVTMGMDLSANWGLSLTQQILNFSLFNAVGIAKAGEEMAKLGADADSDDLLTKTATLYYNAQVLQYAIGLFDDNLAVMDRMASIMDVSRENGIARKVDADRISVTKTNLETERLSMERAFDVQKNLLKLQMGFPMDEDISLEPLDIDKLESVIMGEGLNGFTVEDQLPYKMLKQQQKMLSLQKKSAIGETLPMLSLSANYSENYMGDHFYGETYHHFPVSMVTLNLRVPLFTGMSKNAKIKKAGIQLEKAQLDEQMLVQSLTMANSNARMQFEQNRSTIESQKRNKELALDVLEVTEKNYNEGISTLSDLLNASSSLIQAQMNYINALNSSVKAYLDLKKANGTINEIIK